MAQVDYPKSTPAGEMTAEEYVVSLYEALGWDKQSDLDPKKIIMNPDHWRDIADALNRSEEGRTAGFVWMNYGPSADAAVPYGKIEIEDGAFGRGGPSLPETTKRHIDSTVSSQFAVEGNVVHLDADRTETNEFLLQNAYDSRHMAPSTFLESLHEQIGEAWMDSIDLAVDDVLTRAGIAPYSDERYDAARDYLIESYSFEPPYAHYLDQDTKVNIMLGTSAEKNLDFGSIRAVCDCLNSPEALSADDLDNGLMWLIEQQGHTLDELSGALSNYEKWGFDAAEMTHGTFLASVVEEMSNFTNVMGSITVLAEMSMHDMAKLMEPKASLVMPKDSVIGIFAPWIGGGSMLGIQLEKDLVIPPDVRFDLTIEGANCDVYTVGDVYGLVGEAWKKPLDVTDPIRGYDNLDEVMKEAKDRAGEKNLAHLDASKSRKPPEVGR